MIDTTNKKARIKRATPNNRARESFAQKKSPAGGRGLIWTQ
jgi:hypothetical protein